MRLIDARLVQEIADREIGGETASLVQYVLSHTPTIEVKDLIEYHLDELSRTIHCSVIEAEPVRHGRWVK